VLSQSKEYIRDGDLIRGECKNFLANNCKVFAKLPCVQEVAVQLVGGEYHKLKAGTKKATLSVLSNPNMINELYETKQTWELEIVIIRAFFY
jgi:hypothetical protein